MGEPPLTNKDVILQEYQNLVYRIAVSYVKNRYDADDIFQDVFIALFKQSEPFESMEHQKAWIIKTTINRCKRHFLRARRNQTVNLLDHDEAVQPEKNYDYVYQAILSLKPKPRMIVYLHYIEELSIKEVAMSMNLSEANVKVILHRTRQKLKERIDLDES